MTTLQTESFGKPEIERRFILQQNGIEHYPIDTRNDEVKMVRHIYLHDKADELELRVSRSGTKHTATLKDTGGLQRSELEVDISAAAYDAFDEPDAAIVEKLVCETPEGLEIARYKGVLSWLSIVELEFDSNIEAESYQPPALYTEVTDNDAYNDRNLANVAERPEKRPLTIQDISKIDSELREKQSKSDAPYLVGIAGPSAGGKSTTAKQLAQEMARYNPTLVSMDDYIRGRTKLEAMQGGSTWENWDIPLVYDYEALNNDLQKLQNGESIEKPIYDFETSERIGRETIKPSALIIVEGLYALTAQLQEL